MTRRSRQSTAAAVGLGLLVAVGCSSASRITTSLATPVTPPPSAESAQMPTSLGSQPTRPPQAQAAPLTNTRATGIQDLAQAPFSQQEFGVSNQYRASSAKGWVVVYAGAAVAINADGSQSVLGPGLRLYDGSDSPDTSYIGQFLVSGKSGTAKITSADAGGVTLSLSDGRSYRFNFATNTYASI